MRVSRLAVKLGAVVVATCVAACSSSGGGGVSTTKLESKLKNEPAISSVISQGGAKAKVTSQLVDCIAKALKKDADPDDLAKYVDGKMNLNDIGGKDKGSANDAQSDAKTCAQNAVKQDKSSAP